MIDEKLSWGKALFRSVAELAAMTLRAFTLTMLWKWFCVSSFGVNPVGIPAAIGIVLMVRLVGIPAIPSDVIIKLDTWGERQGFTISLSLLVLLFGYLASLFM